MPKYRVPVLRTATEYGYFEIEAQNKDEALTKAQILFEISDPDNMEPTGRVDNSELLEDEIERVEGS